MIGRNGSGKSSLLKRMATGMIPGFPLHLKVKYVSQELPLVLVGGKEDSVSKSKGIRQRADGSVEVDSSLTCIEVIVCQLNAERQELDSELQYLEELLTEEERTDNTQDGTLDVGAITDRMEEINERIAELELEVAGHGQGRSDISQHHEESRREIVAQQMRARAWEMLKGLQFDKRMANSPVSVLSGMILLPLCIISGCTW